MSNHSNAAGVDMVTALFTNGSEKSPKKGGGSILCVITIDVHQFSLLFLIFSLNKS